MGNIESTPFKVNEMTVKLTNLLDIGLVNEDDKVNSNLPQNNSVMIKYDISIGEG